MSLALSSPQRRIYLDAMASGPLHPQVAAAFDEHLRHTGNSSSIHWHGRRAQEAIDAAAVRMARLLGVTADEIVFTSGGTESNNLALKGIALKHLGLLPRIVTSAIEHPSVLETCRYLRQLGIDIVEVPVDRTGRIDPEQVSDAITAATVLVSVMWANNETGTIQPIPEIAEICRTRGVPLHCDATQAVGRIPVGAAGIDLLTCSAHKFYGPQGCGVLVVRRGLRLVPLLHGGEQQQGRRAGTVSAAVCAGAGVAAELAEQEIARRQAVLAGLVERFLRVVQSQVDDVHVNGSRTFCLPGALNLSVPGTRGDALVAAMDLEGVSVSHGSACASGASRPSHVLLAMGLSERLVRAAVRISPTPWTTEDEIDYAAEVYVRAVRRQREGSRRKVG